MDVCFVIAKYQIAKKGAVEPEGGGNLNDTHGFRACCRGQEDS